MASDIECFVSVVICTRNRSRSLARTLESIVLASEGASEPWELIIVDNGSTDDTVTMASGFASRLPLRVVSEPVPGLSNARNAGIRKMRGAYVLWTDDDVVVDRQWLQEWMTAFRQRPQDSIFGGRSEPAFEEPRQKWFIEGKNHLQALLAVRDADWQKIDEDRLPWGLNFAVRAQEQLENLYDPDLGVAPGRRRGGEETAVLKSILAKGGEGSWVWKAKVYHMIPPERQTASYIVTYYYNIGFDDPVVDEFGTRKSLLASLYAFLVHLLIVKFSISIGKRNVAQLVAYGKLKGTVVRHIADRIPTKVKSWLVSIIRQSRQL